MGVLPWPSAGPQTGRICSVKYRAQRRAVVSSVHRCEKFFKFKFGSFYTRAGHACTRKSWIASIFAGSCRLKRSLKCRAKKWEREVEEHSGKPHGVLLVLRYRTSAGSCYCGLCLWNNCWSFHLRFGHSRKNGFRWLKWRRVCCKMLPVTEPLLGVMFCSIAFWFWRDSLWNFTGKYESLTFKLTKLLYSGI